LLKFQEFCGSIARAMVDFLTFQQNATASDAKANRCALIWGRWRKIRKLEADEMIKNERNMTCEFIGNELDDESGLNYFGARYYDSDIGGWVSVDPMRQYISPFLYAGNGTNPINGVDEDGNKFNDYAEDIYTEAACMENPFYGSSALEADLNEMRNSDILFEAFPSNGNASFGPDDIRIAEGQSSFEMARVLRHEGDHWFFFSWEKELANAGLIPTKARWHNDAQEIKDQKFGGSQQKFLEWNSALPRGSAGRGVYYRWDSIYGRDRVIYNQANWPK